jgi:6-pyruvoyltetrahydropterin/6-carboxytetrahydropterin synthase
MSIVAIRRIQFCAGHRVLNHESKCANAHGHNYILHAYASANSLDQIGRVIDFSVMKEKIGRWIDANWDHTFLIYEKDEKLLAVADMLSVNKPVYRCGFNPTAENMARHLLNEIFPAMFESTGVDIVKVVLHETENCSVEVEK